MSCCRKGMLCRSRWCLSRQHSATWLPGDHTPTASLQVLCTHPSRTGCQLLRPWTTPSLLPLSPPLGCLPCSCEAHPHHYCFQVSSSHVTALVDWCGCLSLTLLTDQSLSTCQSLPQFLQQMMHTLIHCTIHDLCHAKHSIAWHGIASHGIALHSMT